jgi:DNA-binding transcriptional MocR family regulator
MHLILSTLLDTSNGFIFVDDVTYMIALHVFAQFPNVRVFPVSSTRHGTNIESLENLLKKYQFVSNSKMFWGMYYTIPTFHNPMGILFNEGLNFLI